MIGIYKLFYIHKNCHDNDVQFIFVLFSFINKKENISNLLTLILSFLLISLTLIFSKTCNYIPSRLKSNNEGDFPPFGKWNELSLNSSKYECTRDSKAVNLWTGEYSNKWIRRCIDSVSPLSENNWKLKIIKMAVH